MIDKYMIFVYFFYGLAWKVMGIITLVEGRKKSQFELVKYLPILGVFGILHGFAEWVDMFLLMPPAALGVTTIFLEELKALLVITSFIALLTFGTKLLHANNWKNIRFVVSIIGALFVGASFYFFISLAFKEALQYSYSFSRYLLAFPAALFSGIGLILEAKKFENPDLLKVRRNFILMGYAFLIYSVIGGLISTPIDWGIFAVINTHMFYEFTGLPIQFFRAACAVLVAILSIKSLDIFEFEYQKAERMQLSYLKRMSIMDEVSGLYNHRYFQETLAELTKDNNNQLAVILLDIDYFKSYNDAFGHPEGDRLLKQLGILINTMISKDDIVARYGGDELAVILPNANKETALDFAHALLKKIRTQEFGITKYSEGNNITASIGVATFPDIANNKNSLIQFADFALYRAKRLRNCVELYSSVLDDLKDELDSSEIGIINTVKTLISVINAKDQYTFGHSERVMALAVSIAKKLSLAEEDIRKIRFAAYLHDIGKIEIDRELLNKKDPLTNEEFAKIKRHPVNGAEIIKPIKTLKGILPCVLYHHERYDGMGYPEGLSGKNIPLEARIIALADSFDAMVTTRPYKKGKTVDEAIEELQMCSGTQFDPDIVKILLSLLNEHNNSYNNILNVS